MTLKEFLSIPLRGHVVLHRSPFNSILEMGIVTLDESKQSILVRLETQIGVLQTSHKSN
jgi:hypothetical protein